MQTRGSGRFLFSRFVKFRKIKEIILTNSFPTDQEISDIAHYLEFKRPGIADGYRTSMMLHSLRLRRRTIKDNIQCAGWFLTTTADAIIGGELERKLDTMKRRKYTPRVRTELFESSES